MAKTSTGLSENIAGLLCYVLGWVSGVIFLLIDRDNKYVRFHAIQSIVTFGSINVVVVALSIISVIPLIGVVFGFVNWLLGIVAFILWVVLMVKAGQGTKYKLPWAGDFAAQRAGSDTPGEGGQDLPPDN